MISPWACCEPEEEVAELDVGVGGEIYVLTMIRGGAGDEH